MRTRRRTSLRVVLDLHRAQPGREGLQRRDVRAAEYARGVGRLVEERLDLAGHDVSDTLDRVQLHLPVRFQEHRADPAMPAPHPFRRPVEVAPGMLVAGDHRDTSSIQGALVSGRRAAASVLAAL